MGRRSATCTRASATLASIIASNDKVPPRCSPTLCATRAIMAATLQAARSTATTRSYSTAPRSVSHAQGL
eukprot:262572-Pleurochrysis_carterae.AAC.1